MAISVVEKLGAINGLYTLSSFGKTDDLTARPDSWTTLGRFQGVSTPDALLIEGTDVLLIEGTDELLIG